MNKDFLLSVTSVIHLVVFELVSRIHKNKATDDLGFVLFLQFIGVFWLIAYFTNDDITVKTFQIPITFIVFGVAFITLMQKNAISINRKKYTGFAKYYILIDTDLKYVFSFFLMSLAANMIFNPFQGIFNYMQLTVLLAFAGSLWACKGNSIKKKLD